MLFHPYRNRIRLIASLICAAFIGMGRAQQAVAAPIVTLTLSINDDGAGNYAPGQFAVYAGDSLDNGGIAGVGFSLGGNWTSDSVVAPDAVYDILDAGVFVGQVNIRGFTQSSTPDVNPVFLAQSYIFSPDGNAYGLPPFDHSEPVYGFGQTAGSLPPDPTQAVQPSYGAPVLLLQGTFGGTISLVGGDYTNTNTYVFDDTSSANTESVTVDFATQTLPEPASGLLMLITAGLLGRMPRRIKHAGRDRF
jgi:hypothetical protein